MPKQIARTGNAVIYVQNDGLFNAATPFERGQAGMTDITLPGPGARTVFYFGDEFGNPLPGGAERAAPGQPGTSIENYAGFVRDMMQKMADLGLKRNIQLRLHNCISLDHPGGWFPDGVLLHFGNTQTGDLTISAPATREFSDTRIGQSTPITPIYHVFLVGQSLTRLTTTENTDGNSIWFLSEPDSFGNCGNGYPGADKIGYIACDADSGVAPEVLYTITGGSSWAECTGNPFAADEHASHIIGRVLNKTQYRVICGRITTDAGAGAEIGYADVTIGAGGDIASFTNVTITGTANGETITAIVWPSLNRLYVATSGGEIYLSEDQGATWASTYSSSNAINGFHKAFNGNLYAIGAGGSLVVEKNESGTFESLTDPTGTDAGTAVFATQDGLWVGNGTSIFYSRNLLPASVNDWTSSKSFGANHVVRSINCAGRARAFGGDSQLVRVLVSDTSGNEGDVWFTSDGGGYWQEVANLTNSGYNAIFWSEVDDNLAFIVGEDNSSTTLIHKLAPAAGV